MLKLKKKSHLSVELNDYVLRGLVKKGPTPDQWDIVEIVLPNGVVAGASIADEMGLYQTLKRNVPILGGKNQDVRLFVPDTSVLLKSFEHPAEIKNDKLQEYVQMELGRTIHLPFQEPLVDVFDPIPDDGQAVMFAVPPEEVGKFVGILQDVNLNPEAADIRALCNLRLLEKIKKIDKQKTFLIADWSINELKICIFTNDNVEFIRFQSIDTDMTKWKATIANHDVEFNYDGDLQEYMMRVTDQVLELDRILNFFRFSLHKGEKSVDEMIIMGDNPYLQEISEIIRENINTPLQIIDDAVIQKHYPKFKAKHTSLIGLALKEV